MKKSTETKLTSIIFLFIVHTCKDCATFYGNHKNKN